MHEGASCTNVSSNASPTQGELHERASCATGAPGPSPRQVLGATGFIAVPRLKLPGGNDVREGAWGRAMQEGTGHQAKLGASKRGASTPVCSRRGQDSARGSGRRSKPGSERGVGSQRGASSSRCDQRKLRSGHESSNSEHGSRLDPGVDDLLLQLDDLDARSKALQREKANPTSEEAEPKSKTCATEADATNKLSAAQAVARQHPLQSLGLAAGGSSEPRWQGARRREHRPPRAPSNADAIGASPWRGQHKGSQALDLAPSFADAYPETFTDPAKLADVGQREAAAHCVPLPPLKSSASAPSCLMQGSWPAAPARGC